MSDKLKKQIKVELEQLENLLNTYQPLFKKCISEPLDPIEISALAAMLHAFYTGIENIFKRVSTELDGGLPKTEIWHRTLFFKCYGSSWTYPPSSYLSNPQRCFERLPRLSSCLPPCLYF